MGFLAALLRVLVTFLACIWLIRQLFPRRKASSCAENALNARLMRMKSISLTPPLTEKARPARLCDIVGQDEGIRALRAALFGKYPQHVILYGPPGVGKTCAARLVFEEARKSKLTPFRADAPFIEMDASILRFDERGIADPLLGSVHDPIYQGAGEKGEKGVPMPKEGAVTRAHGGILFLDEIGQMHPGHMNRLLKVMEDRKVRLESAYFDASNPAAGEYVKTVFASGLPADFRLIAATTKRPDELPAALRSRCMEIFFQPLSKEALSCIAKSAAERAGIHAEKSAFSLAGALSDNGRDLIRLLLLASGAAAASGRERFTKHDLEWAAAATGKNIDEKACAFLSPGPGKTYVLSVNGAGRGCLSRLEAAVCKGTGKIFLSGAAITECIRTDPSRKIEKPSSVCASAQTAVFFLKTIGYPLTDADVFLSLPSGTAADGPSAGCAMAVAIASYMDKIPLRTDAAVTGEITLSGEILPVGGIDRKAEAAHRAGLKEVLIPEKTLLPSKRIRFSHVSDFESAYARMRLNPVRRAECS